MSKKIDYAKFEDKLRVIYPELSQKQAKIITKQLFVFWGEMIENIDKIKQ